MKFLEELLEESLNNFLEGFLNELQEVSPLTELKKTLKQNSDGAFNRP